MKKEIVLGINRYTLTRQVALAIDPQNVVTDHEQHAAGLHWLPSAHVDTLLAELESDLVLMAREHMEKNAVYRHFITYDLFIRKPQVTGGLFDLFVYQRTKGAGEAKLHLSFSCGVGGHVELCDAKTFNHAASQIDLPTTIAQGRRREQDSELDMIVGDPAHQFATRSPFPSDYFEEEPHRLIATGVLLDDSNDVGLVHVGLCNLYLLDADAALAMGEEDEHITVGFLPLEPAILEAGEFENWSKMLINSLLGPVSPLQSITGL